MLFYIFIYIVGTILAYLKSLKSLPEKPYEYSDPRFCGNRIYGVK